MTDHEEKIEALPLADGRVIAVAESPDLDDGLILTLSRQGDVIGESRLPYPRGGFAGGEFIAGPGDRFAIFSYYSGQSEQAHQIFRIENDGWSLVGSLAYTLGESAAFTFSKDEATLVAAIGQSCVEWWSPWSDGDTEIGPPGFASFEFGSVHFHHLKSGETSHHTIRAVAPENWIPAEHPFEPELHPRLVTDGVLRLAFPWGDEDLDLPLPGVVTVPIDVDRA